MGIFTFWMNCFIFCYTVAPYELLSSLTVFESRIKTSSHCGIKKKRSK